MDIHIRKIRLAQRVLGTEDEQTITLLEQVLKERRIKEYEDKMRPMSMTELREQIAEAEQDFEHGHYKDAPALLEKYK